MPVSVLNNVASLAAQNQLTITNGNLQRALFQLSSGSRINTGADDAAGLAIADGLHANITALTQSSRNANDGVGELQVADGSLAQVTTLLNRAITLATESATGTVSDPQRIALDAEYTAIKAEVDRIGAKTNYNGGAVFNAGSLDVFLSDGNATSNSTIGVATGLLSSAGLGLGGATPSIATLTQSGAAAPATATLSQAAGSAAAAATTTLTQGVTGGTAATATFTTTAPIVAGDTVSVAGTTYTFAAALTGGGATANQILLGASQTSALANLASAVNGTAGSGTTYGSTTVANTFASATSTATTAVFTARTAGTAGNALASTVTGTASNTFAAATFAGGVAGTAAVPANGDTVSIGGTTYTFRTALTASTTANEVLIGANEAAALTNLAEAVNATPAGSGTLYGSTTVANTNVTAVAGATSVVFTATTPGIAGNAITSTSTGAAGTFTGATLSGGTAAGANAAAGDTVNVAGTAYSFVTALTGTGTANQVVVGNTEALSLANLAAAVNGSAGVGTTYGTGTVANTSATATAGTTSITFTARTAGATGNTLASTATGTANTFGAATFANGTDAGAAGVAAAGDTVTVGGTTYSFVAALTGAPNQVLVGATNGASLAHLAAAINGSAGSGSTFGAGTVANTSASARATANSIVFTALQTGVPGNSLVSTTTGSGGNTFGSTTFAGGSVGTPNDLLSIPDATAALATISASIQTVAALRGTIGATVNRLQSAANVINNQVQNLTGAEDGIRAADLPSTIATLAKYSILEQTGISALAQANQQQQLVLKLLQ